MNSETTSFPESLFFPTSGRRETLETRLIAELIGSCRMLVQNFADWIENSSGVGTRLCRLNFEMNYRMINLSWSGSRLAPDFIRGGSILFFVFSFSLCQLSFRVFLVANWRKWRISRWILTVHYFIQLLGYNSVLTFIAIYFYHKKIMTPHTFDDITLISCKVTE